MANGADRKVGRADSNLSHTRSDLGFDALLSNHGDWQPFHDAVRTLSVGPRLFYWRETASHHPHQSMPTAARLLVSAKKHPRIRTVPRRRLNDFSAWAGTLNNFNRHGPNGFPRKI